MTYMHTADGGRPPQMATDWMAVHGSALVEMGYPIIPIIPGAKCPGQWRQATGWQAYPDWSRHCDRLTKSFELNIWERWPGCGIGMAAGKIGGLDLDVLDADISAELRRRAFLELGETPAERIGRAPKRLLVYRMAEPFAKIAMHPLEFMGRGSQFVCYGIHPDTQNPYQWPMEDLAEIMPHRLPVVTEAQVRAFMVEAMKILPPELRRKTLGPDRSADFYYSGGELAGTVEAVGAAIQFIPNDDLHYDDWIKVGLALKGAVGAAGADLFAEWSSRSAKDVPAATLKAWNGFKPTNIGAGTIYYYAQQYGWSPDDRLILRRSLADAMAAVDFSKLITQAPKALPAHDPETGEVHDEPEPEQERTGSELVCELCSDLPAAIIGEQFRHLPRREMLVKGLFGVGELSVTYGAPKTGKSFLLTSVALAIACGEPDWFGHRIKRPGMVIYCIMEGSGGFPNRLAAWSEKTGRTVPDSFVYVPVRLRFLSDPPGPLHRRRKAIAEDIVRLGRLVTELEARSGAPCVMLVVDTVARAMTGRDENSTQDMGEFVDACAELQGLPGRPHVALVHHESKSGNMRGSSALLGAGDTMLRVQRTEAGREWAVEYSKDDADGEDHAFDLEMVTLGTDDDGDAITSCVIVDQGKPAPKKPKEKPQTNGDRSLAALAAAIARFGVAPPDGYEIPVEYVVTISQWRGVAIETIPGETREQRSDGFRKASQRLEQAGVVMMSGQFAWFADAGAQSAAQMARSARG